MTPARSLLCSSSLIALALTAATGCEIDMSLGDVDEASTTASTGDGTGASSGASTAASSNTGVAEGTSSVAEGTSGGDGTSTGSGSGDTDAAVCDPPPEDLAIYVDFDPDGFPDSGDVVVDAACVIQGMVEDGDIRTYAIECDEGGVAVLHELEVTRSTGPIDLPLAVGTPIHLQAARNYPIDSVPYVHVVIRDAAGELVLGQHYGRDEPGLGVDVDAWFAPLEYALAFGDCEPVPYEDSGSTFIVDLCPAAVTRLALDFQLGDEGIHLLAGTSGQLGPLSLFVTEARHLDPIDPKEPCPLPIDAFSFVAYREA